MYSFSFLISLPMLYISVINFSEASTISSYSSIVLFICSSDFLAIDKVSVTSPLTFATDDTISFIISCISFTDSDDWLASSLTSSATTENPFPCSPALAASIAAFNAKRLVCSAIPLIVLVIMFIELNLSDKLIISSFKFSALFKLASIFSFTWEFYKNKAYY